MSIRGFSRTQIALHWIIAVLVVVQVLVAPGVASAHSALENGESLSGGQVFLSRLHVLTGLSILLPVIIRLGVGIVEGAPPSPGNESPAVAPFSRSTHFCLYAALFLMLISGSLAWFYGNENAAGAHAFARYFLILFVVLHDSGALWHHYYLNDSVLKRMTRAGYLEQDADDKAAPAERPR